LAQDNLKLKQDNDNLRIMSDRILKENADLSARLSSLAELKKAIRKVKLDIHFKKVQEWLARARQRKEENIKRLLEGNQGFFIRNGKPGEIPRLKIKISDAVEE
jgi:N-methylhydantoinase B/oxoprolinase/acetone carboxylase alpha subunit